MFDTKRFGAYISKLRKKADMTQSEFAERLSLTRQAISKYECGDSFPDISILITISDIFHITLDELIGSGNPTAKEAAILEGVAGGRDFVEMLDTGSICEIVNLAPLLKPSLLDKLATGLAKQGIDISNILSLAEYMQDEAVAKLLANACYDTLNEELLEKLIPFLDRHSNAVIFQKILDGELDYRLIRIMLPYEDHMDTQIEAAVLYGALDKNALDIVREWRNGQAMIEERIDG